jgi:hypothetical protein
LPVSGETDQQSERLFSARTFDADLKNWMEQRRMGRFRDDGEDSPQVGESNEGHVFGGFFTPDIVKRAEALIAKADASLDKANALLDDAKLMADKVTALLGLKK